MNVDFLRNLADRVASTGFGRLAEVAMRVRDFGTESYPAATQRRLRQVNVLNAFMVASYLVFAVFYLVLDWPGLKLLALAILANVPLFLVPPFLHRYSEIAAINWLAVQNALTFLVFGLIVGSAAGMQFWLLAAGSLVIFYGIERLPIALEEGVEQVPPGGIGEGLEDGIGGHRGEYVTKWSHVKARRISTDVPPWRAIRTGG